MSLPPQKSAKDLAQDRERSSSLDKHRAAMFVLTQKDRPIPSLQEMKDDLAKDDLTSIKDRIVTAKTDHKSNLERMYAAHAEEYLDDQRLRRESREEYARQPDSSSRLAEWSEKRDPLSVDHHYLFALGTTITNERLRHTAHLYQLELTRKDIETRIDEERRRRDAQFPLSLAEFQAKPRDIQIRIATWLSADNIKKERMMNEFGWVWRQTKSLAWEYGTNEEFKTGILRLLETLDSRDPRKKPI
ncbi:hypothetical protein P691DRAFT_740020 [Macrolepiota fuliginosa MF-IS2]|uniref:Uncharacterized protein n=1 Tax=Macrolepiota fuliginosa MF-IS2 TaxID=1400762 RepID=A0A9P5WZS8_9AGAR|nr:hypothetical protein P691DRAFT_740020 [Macrolepiota fuliginosa MF-IS2]